MDDKEIREMLNKKYEKYDFELVEDDLPSPEEMRKGLVPDDVTFIAVGDELVPIYKDEVGTDMESVRIMQEYNRKSSD